MKPKRSPRPAKTATGTYTLTAAYSGDTNFTSSTSAASKVKVGKAATVTGIGLSVTSAGVARPTARTPRPR